MKFPSQMRILEQPSIVLFQEGDAGGQFNVYLTGNDPVSGVDVMLRLGARAEPVGGDRGDEILARLERARADQEAAFAAKD